MYLAGLDQVLLKMVNYKLTLFPLTGLSSDPYTYSRAYPMYQVVLAYVFELLEVFIFLNPCHIRELLQKNNLRVFTNFLTVPHQQADDKDHQQYSTHKLAFN
jgi:hypothetical protein